MCVWVEDGLSERGGKGGLSIETVKVDRVKKGKVGLSDRSGKVWISDKV